MESDAGRSPVRQPGVIVANGPRVRPASPAAGAVASVDSSHHNSQSHPHLVFSRPVAATRPHQQQHPQVSINSLMQQYQAPAPPLSGRQRFEEAMRTDRDRQQQVPRNIDYLPQKTLENQARPRALQGGILQQVLQKTVYRPMDMSVYNSSNNSANKPQQQGSTSTSRLQPVYRTSRPFNDGPRHMQQSALRTSLTQGPPRAAAPTSTMLNRFPARPPRFAPPLSSPSPSSFRSPAPRPTGALKAALGNNNNQTNNHDSLAKISELAEISRASIPMPPLEDDDVIAVDSPRSEPRTSHLAMELSRKSHSHRQLMPPPRSPNAVPDAAPCTSPMPAPPRKSMRTSRGDQNLRSEWADSGIDVEIVHSLDPVPETAAIESKITLLDDPNLGFDDFFTAVDYLSLHEPPLNPLDLESKDELLAVFGPNLTLYQCGGCDSTFIFRQLFVEHFYRGVIPYYLDCDHCQERLPFSNICQVKDHVKAHNFDVETSKGFCLTIGGELEDSPYSINTSTKAGVKRDVRTDYTPPPEQQSIRQQAQAAEGHRRPSPHNYNVPDLDQRSMVPVKELSEKRQELQKLSQVLAENKQPLQNRGRLGTTISVNQILEREFPSKIATKAKVNSSLHTKDAASGIPCSFCSSRFDDQSGVTHHFQRCRDVAKAAQEFRCNKCDIVCCNSCSFEAHRKLHNLRLNPSMIDVCCPECGLRMKTPEEVERHVGRRCVHFSRLLCVSYACCVINCRFHITNEAEYLRHVATEHGGTAADRGTCPVCKAIANGPRTELVRHLTANPPCRQRIMQQKSHFFAYKCNYCDEKTGPVYETKAAMREHIASAHPDNIPPISERISPETSSFSAPVSVPARSPVDADHTSRHCTLCRDEFSAKSFARPTDALEAHIFRAHVPAKYPAKCGHCDKVMVSGQELFRHLLEEVFQLPVRKCNDCRFVTLSEGGLASHTSVFHRHRSLHAFVCVVCQKVGYESAVDLRSHFLLMHGNGEESFRSKDEERKPSPTMRRSRPSSAEPLLAMQKLSSKRPADEESFRSVKQRTLPTNFACCLCSFECSNHVQFADHVQVNHGAELNEVAEMRLSKGPAFAKYTCKVCEEQKMSFICDSQLIFHEHVRQTHPSRESSYQCAECALQLLSLSVLQMHLRVVHGIRDPHKFLATCAFYQKPARNPVISGSSSAGSPYSVSSPVTETVRIESPTSSRLSRGAENSVSHFAQQSPSSLRTGSQSSSMMQ